MTIRLPGAFALALFIAAPATAHDADVTTRAYLDQPEVFQIATLAGAMAILQLPDYAGEPGDAVCFARWPVHEDVLAIFAEHASRNPLVLDDRFGPTLVAALRERCRRGP